MQNGRSQPSFNEVWEGSVVMVLKDKQQDMPFNERANISYMKRSEYYKDALILLFSVVPLLMTRHIPLGDLPNHTARQFIVDSYGAFPSYSEFYSVKWGFVPNIGLDLFVYVLHNFVSIEMSIRLFCISALVLLFFGTRLINMSLGGAAAVAYRAAPIFFYSGPFQYGFINFIFGIGLAVTLFGVYVRYRGSSPVKAGAALAVGCVAVLLCHLVAYCIYALAVLTFELNSSWTIVRRSSIWRDVKSILLPPILGGLHLAPPLILYLALSRRSNASASLKWGGSIRWGDIHDKIDAIAALTTYSHPIELVILVLTIVGLGFALAKGVLRLHPKSVLPVGALSALVFIAPRDALGGGWLDYRMPAATVFFVLGFLTPGPNPLAYASLLRAWFAALIMARVALIAGLWISWEPIFDQYEAAFQRLPEGSRLMVVKGDPRGVSGGPRIHIRRPPLENVAAWAVARRGAFEPEIFAGISGSILNLKPPYDRLYATGLPTTLDKIDPIYDSLLVIYPRGAKISPAIPLVSLYKGSTFELFRVIPAPAQLSGRGSPQKTPATQS